MLRNILDEEYSMDKSYKPKIFKTISVVKTCVLFMQDLERQKKKRILQLENQNQEKKEEPNKIEDQKKEEQNKKEIPEKNSNRLNVIEEESSYINENENSHFPLVQNRDESNVSNKIEQDPFMGLTNQLNPNYVISDGNEMSNVWKKVLNRETKLLYSNDSNTFINLKKIKSEEKKTEPKEIVKELIIQNNESFFYENTKKNDPNKKSKNLIFINKRKVLMMRKNEKNIECFSLMIIKPIDYRDLKTFILSKLKFIIFLILTIYIYIYLMIFINSIHKQFGDKIVQICIMPVISMLVIQFLIN